MMKKKAEKVQTAIYRQTNSTKGYTLVELLVVVAIIGMITSYAISKVSTVFKTSLNAASREIASKIKETYNSAMVTGRVHRVVYDLENSMYWVEVGPKTFLLDSEASKELDEKYRKFGLSEEEEEKKKKKDFSLATVITRKKSSLPNGVTFKDILTEQAEEAFKDGIVYTHFFPSGLAERTLVHLKDIDDNEVTLAITALIGETRLFYRYVDKKEAFAVK